MNYLKGQPLFYTAHVFNIKTKFGITLNGNRRIGNHVTERMMDLTTLETHPGGLFIQKQIAEYVLKKCVNHNTNDRFRETLDGTTPKKVYALYMDIHRVLNDRVREYNQAAMFEEPKLNEDELEKLGDKAYEIFKEEYFNDSIDAFLYGDEEI